MKEKKYITCLILTAIGIFFITGCTRTVPVSYHRDMARVPTSSKVSKDIKVGIAKFADKRSLVEENKPKSESYIFKRVAWRFGATFEGSDYYPVKDMVQKLLVDNFINSGINAKPINMVLSSKDKQDFHTIGKESGVDYIIGGEIMEFMFDYKDAFWYLIQRREATLNVFFGKVQGKAMLFENTFTKINSENAMVAVHANNADKLVNKVFNEIMGEILVQVIDRLSQGQTTMTAEEILLLKKAGVSDEKILEMHKEKEKPAHPMSIPKINPFDWNEDGKKDIIFGSNSGRVYVYLNKGDNQQPLFDKPKPLPNVKIARDSYPYIVDWNNDGKKDFIIGSSTGEISVFINKGTNHQPFFDEEIKLNDGDLDVGFSSSPAMVDWNGDGKKDLIVGNRSGKVFVFFNLGFDNLPRFQSDLDGAETSIKVPGYATPFIVDWNNDGKFDVICGSSDGKVYVFINEGDSKNPKFGKGQILHVNNKEFKFASHSSVAALDWDDDGKIDLLIYNKLIADEEQGSDSEKIIPSDIYLLMNTGTKEKPEFKELKPVKGKFKDDAVL